MKQARKDARRDAAAAHRLAGWYARGEEGLDRDLSVWLRWETEAAERKCADAQVTLGCACYNGAGVPVDHAMAFAWFQKAALQGRFSVNLPLQLNFSTIMSEGKHEWLDGVISGSS